MRSDRRESLACFMFSRVALEGSMRSFRWWIFLDDKSKIFYYPGFFAVLSVGSMNCRTSSGLESNFSGNAVTRALRWAARSSAFRVLLKVLVLKGRRREEDIVEDGKIS